MQQNAYDNWMLFTPSFTPPDGPTSPALAGLHAASVTRLPKRAVLLFSGVDAAAFLQGQLTADVAQITAGTWRAAGYCSPKGRLLASGLIWQTGAGFAWLVSADVIDSLVKRLRMFVMRAKVTITAADVAVFGVTAVSGDRVIERLADVPSVEMLALPAVMQASRAFAVIEGPAAIDAFEKEATALGVSGGSSALWDWLEVRSGMSFIEARTQDRFVPQMVNLEALGGVDFKKGCFPGQEVVARSQYLGKLKRRTLIAHRDAGSPPAPGSDVLSMASQSAVGTIVGAALAPDGTLDCLIEAPLSAWEAGLSLPDHPDIALEQFAPPYVLPDNEVFVRPRL